MDYKEGANFTFVTPGKAGKLTWLPYEVVIALLVTMAGIFRFFDPIVSESVKPLWLTTAISILYISSGLMMLFGLWKMNLRAELAGSLLLVNAVLTGTLAAYIFGEERLLQSNVSFLIVLLGVTIRVYQVLKNRRIIQIEILDSETLEGKLN